MVIIFGLMMKNKIGNRNYDLNNLSELLIGFNNNQLTKETLIQFSQIILDDKVDNKHKINILNDEE